MCSSVPKDSGWRVFAVTRKTGWQVQNFRPNTSFCLTFKLLKFFNDLWHTLPLASPVVLVVQS